MAATDERLNYCVKEFLPNGDLVIDGSGLYRTYHKGEVADELDEKYAKHLIEFMNEPPKIGGFTAVPYSELAKQ